MTSGAITPLGDQRESGSAKKTARSISVRGLVITQTCISTLINAFIPASIIGFSGLAPPSSLTGSHGIIPAVSAATALPIFLMTIALTSALRRKVARHEFPCEIRLKRRFTTLSLTLLPRATVLTLLGLVVFAPAAVGLVYVQSLLPMTKYGFALFNITYGALIGIVFTPLIVLATLAEREVDMTTRIRDENG